MFGTIAKIATAPGRMAAKAIAGSAKTEGGLGGDNPKNDPTLDAINKGAVEQSESAKEFLRSFIFGKGRKKRKDPVEDFKISRQ